MAKRMIAESKEAGEAKVKELEELAAKPLPEITFAEAEVQKVADFINYMYQNAEFKGTMATFKNKLAPMFSDVGNHVKKMEGYIFEFKRVSMAKKAVE